MTMNTNLTRCNSCGSAYAGTWGSILCPTCQQTRKLEEHAELDRRLHQQQMKQQIALGFLNAESAKITAQAIERQTKAIFETSITPNEVYDEGYQYIDKYFASNNYLNLDIWVTESSIVEYTIDIPYVTPKLQDKFKEGLNKKLNSLTVPGFEHMSLNAELAGREVAKKTLDPYFSLFSGLIINGVEIPTKPFDSKLTESIDKKTGELTIFWHSPFESEELNEAFESGINSVCRELNTDELKQKRLHEIEETERKEQHEKRISEKINIDDPFRMRAKQELNFIFTIGKYIFPFVFFVFSILFIPGMASVFFVFFIMPIIQIFIIHMHKKWKLDNNIN